MRDKEIIRFSATHLARLIASRELSCFEVMCAYLDQIEAINPKVNAIISMLDREQLELLAQVKDQEIGRYDVLPPLYGLPLAPKDLTATHGIVTSLGSPIFKDQRNAVDCGPLACMFLLFLTQNDITQVSKLEYSSIPTAAEMRMRMFADVRQGKVTLLIDS